MELVGQQPNAAQRRIYQAAMRLFAQRGSADISISDLAEAAGVARGTIYNNIAAPDRLFEEVSTRLATEMNQSVVAVTQDQEDLALRFAIGIRLYVRRAHEQPDWGRFLVRFGLASDLVRALWDDSHPMRDLQRGMQSRRFDLSAEQARGAIGLTAGTTLTAILLVLDGLRTWRDAGSDAAELVLRALGVEASEAAALSRTELPEGV